MRRTYKCFIIKPADTEHSEDLGTD